MPVYSPQKGKDYYKRYANACYPDSVTLPIYTSPTGQKTILGTWADFIAMDEHYYRDTGKHFVVNSGYRDWELQQKLYVAGGRKPWVAAAPGTSNHGVGYALDIEVDGQQGKVRRWLRANAAAYGFAQPSSTDPRLNYAHPTKSPEPWHWEHLNQYPVHPRGKEIADQFLKGIYIMATIEEVEEMVRRAVREEAGNAVWLTKLAPIGEKAAVDVVGEIHHGTRPEVVQDAVGETVGATVWLTPLSRAGGQNAVDALLDIKDKVVGA